MLFVPTGRPAFKQDRPVTPGKVRLAMVAAAVAGNPAFAVSALEVERPGVTYAVDTLRELREELPGVELVFIVGADAALTLPRWYERAPSWARLAMFAAATRPGFELGEEASARSCVSVGSMSGPSSCRASTFPPASCGGACARGTQPSATWCPRRFARSSRKSQLYRREADHGRLA